MAHENELRVFGSFGIAGVICESIRLRYWDDSGGICAEPFRSSTSLRSSPCCGDASPNEVQANSLPNSVVGRKDSRQVRHFSAVIHRRSSTYNSLGKCRCLRASLGLAWPYLKMRLTLTACEPGFRVCRLVLRGTSISTQRPSSSPAEWSRRRRRDSNALSIGSAAFASGSYSRSRSRSRSFMSHA